MYELVNRISELLPGYMLTFFRITSMLMVMPVFGYVNVPVRVRLAFGFVLSLVISPVVTSYVHIGNVEELLLGVSREIFIGLITGFGARLVFEGFYMAGSFIGRQVGLGIANVMDPSSRQQLPIVSNFWLVLLIVYFLTANAHYYLIEVLVRNFNVVPLGEGSLNAALGRHVVSGGSLFFSIALRMAVPAMVFLLLVDIAISFTARVMPQMNIFFVTLPLKIFTGIVVLIISLDIFQVVFGSFYGELVEYVNGILLLMR